MDNSTRLSLESSGIDRNGHEPQSLITRRREFHRRFKALLKFPAFWIDDAKRQAIAESFGEVVRREGYTCYGCAICSNHAHLVIRIHRDDAVTIWEKFAAESRLRLRTFADVGVEHPVWADRPYKVFLYTPEDMRLRIEYAEKNPLKEGLARQEWAFVKPYDNWPLHKRGGRAKTQECDGTSA